MMLYSCAHMATVGVKGLKYNAYVEVQSIIATPRLRLKILATPLRSAQPGPA